MNYNKDKILMCDRCRCLFVACKNQLKNYNEGIFYLCFRCEYDNELERAGRDSFRKGRDI